MKNKLFRVFGGLVAEGAEVILRSSEAVCDRLQPGGPVKSKLMDGFFVSS